MFCPSLCIHYSWLAYVKIVALFMQFWWAVGSMFGALLALGVMNSLGWHWYLGIATIPLFLVLFIFPVSGVVRSLEINE